jgi:hypothetical protein
MKDKVNWIHGIKIDVYTVINTMTSTEEGKVYWIIKPWIITKYLHVDQKQYRTLPFWNKQKSNFFYTTKNI